MKRNNPVSPAIFFTTPTQDRLRKKHSNNYEEKQTETEAALRVVGYIYLDFVDEAKQLSDSILDKIERQQSVLHHDDDELIKSHDHNSVAHQFILLTQLFDEPALSTAHSAELSISILRTLSEKFLLQQAINNKLIDINKQYSPDMIMKARQTVAWGEDKQKFLIVKNEPVAIAAKMVLMVVAAALKHIRHKIHLHSHDIDIKFNYYAQRLIELSLYSHLRLPVYVSNAIKNVIQHELSLLKQRKNEFVANKNLDLLLQELDAQKATLRRMVACVKSKKQSIAEPVVETLTLTKASRKNSRRKRHQKKIVVCPQSIMLEAYTLLKAGDFTEALKLYDKAMHLAKEGADIVAQVQALLAKAECYEIWFKADTVRANENKEHAIAIFKAVVAQVIHHQHYALYEELVIYQAFANLALDRLLDRCISHDEQMIKDITASKYVDECAPLLMPASESIGQEKEKSSYTLPTLKADMPPAYYKIDGVLEIDSHILALMDDIPDSYIVGGAVRDFVLNTRPREYDVISSLTPEVLYELLVKRGYQCEIVGIAYPIVLVALTASLKVEVATFRGVPPSVSTDKVKYDEKTHMIIYNHNYATHPYEDTFNRDTPINACYYNPRTKEIFTYLKETVDNFESKKLQMIGCPIQRFTEDPIRMLRILELSHRTGFILDESVQAAIFECRNKLKFISPGRLFHQCHKIFNSGHAKPLFYSLLSFQLLDEIFPPLLPHLTGKAITYHPVVQHLFYETDIYFCRHQAISYPLIFATLLWPALLQALKTGDLFESAANDLLSEQRKIISISPYMFSNIKTIWLSFVQENQYFPEQIKGAVAGRNDMSMVCLIEKFSQYVAHYTNYVLSFCKNPSLTRESSPGKSAFFQPARSSALPSAPGVLRRKLGL